MKKDDLSDQLEHLFSDIEVPEPQVTGEEPPETAQRDILTALQPPPAVEVPSPVPTVESVDTARVAPHLEKQPDLQPTQETRPYVPGVFKGITLKWQSRLGRTLMLTFFAAAIVPALIVSAFSVLSQRSRVRSNVLDNLYLLATLQENQTEQWVQSQTSTLISLSREPVLASLLQAYLTTHQSESEAQATFLSIDARLDDFHKQHSQFDEIFLLNPDGQVIVTTDPQHQGKVEENTRYFTAGSQGTYVSSPIFSEEEASFNLWVAEPVRHITGETIAVLVGQIRVESLADLLQTAPVPGSTGEMYLIDKNNRLITPLRRDDAPAPGDVVQSPGIELASSERSGRGSYHNYADRQVFGVYRWLPQVQVGLLVEREVNDAYGRLFATIAGTVAVALVAVTLAVLLADQIARRITQPVVQITESARQMVAGDLNQSVIVNRTDEIGALGQAFNHLADQLRLTIESLEENVAERTQHLQQATDQFRKQATHLEASAEISRAAASILDPQELMQTTVDMIRDRFNFYHVSIFLLDDAAQWAVIAASTGEVGRQMVAQPHRLRVGGDSMVGWACAHRQSRIAFDVGADAVHFDHALLPDTRSEMVLPLLVGDRLLGALDVQAMREAAFDDDDVRSLQGMADLIAIALQNARLFTTTRRGTRHQQLIARITNRMQRAADVPDILTVTIEELADTFDLAQATVCVGTETELIAAGDGREHQAREESLEEKDRPE